MRHTHRTSTPIAVGLVLLFTSTSLWAVKSIEVKYSTDDNGCVMNTVEVVPETTKYKQLNQKMSWKLEHVDGNTPEPGTWKIVEKDGASSFDFCGGGEITFSGNRAECRAKDGNMPSFKYGVVWNHTGDKNCTTPISVDPAIVFDPEGDITALLDSLTFYRVLVVLLAAALGYSVLRLRRARGGARSG